MKYQGPLQIFGYANGFAAGDAGCAEGSSTLYAEFVSRGVLRDAKSTVFTLLKAHLDEINANKINTLKNFSEKLAKLTEHACQQKLPFLTLGGDHSCAIGTWSGVLASCSAKGGGNSKHMAGKTFGLLWVDAHMDAHTLNSSVSQNMHGMPVAALMGQEPELSVELYADQPVLDPKHCALIGVRSFEPPEQALLNQLGVCVYPMSEIQQRGLKAVFDEACAILAERVDVFGVSIDVDGLDPLEAPGVATKVSGGIHVDEFCDSLASCRHLDKLIGVELAEFNPFLDVDHKTLKAIIQILASLLPVHFIKENL